MTSLISINKYRLYCNTSAQWEYLFSTTTPTSCPINAGHTINTNSIQIIDNITVVSLTNSDSPYPLSQSSTFCNTNAGNIIINLPKASKATNMKYMIKKTDATNSVIIIPNGNELIDGISTKTLTSLNDTIVIQSNGVGWTNIGFYDLTIIDDHNAISIDSRQKGDILIDNGKELIPLSVGGDNYILLADSSQQTGIKWSTLNHSFLLNGGINTHTQIDTHIASSSGIHGISGTMVGINNIQTLINKTLTNNTNIIRCTQLATTGPNIVIDSSTNPTNGQALIAITNTTANWGNFNASVIGNIGDVQYNNNALGSTSKLQIGGVNGCAILGEYSGTTPSQPSNGSKLFSRSIGGKKLTSTIGVSGDNYSFQSNLATNKISWWSAQGNGTGVTLINFGNTTRGTITTRNTDTVSLFTSMCRLGYVTSSSAKRTAGTCHGSLQFWIGNDIGLGGFLYVARCGSTVTKSNLRMFIGFTSSTTLLADGDPSRLTNIIGFGVDASDTVFTFMHNDGVGTATKETLTGTFPGNTGNTDMYEFKIFCASNDTSVYYSINNLSQNSFFEGSVNIDLPSNTTLLCPQIWINNNTGGAVGIDIVSQYIETDN